MTSSAGPKQTDISKRRLLVALPSDITNSLQYLDDADLQRLHAAVEAEIDRRKRGASPGKTNKAPAPPASRPVSKVTEIAEIPEGKANLIRASFDAGVKPPTIARTFGVSLSLVNRTIRSSKKK
jgi:hypothetical protein